jgi:gliding motility-associated-like protein
MRLITTILLLLFTHTGAQAVVANFTADFTSGCSPLVVHFTNTSSGATSYAWNLGNGTLTPGINPSTSYITPGTYTVTLTASGSGGSDVKTMVITVHPAPTISFFASDTTVCPGAFVTFTSTSIAGVPGPVTYFWNFGDGSNSTLASPSHSYSLPGNYNVTLSITNSQGCTKLLTKIAYMTIYSPPGVGFTGSPVNVCNPPSAVTFANTSSGALPLSYLWTFGFGPSSTLANPSITYSLPGTYTVKLIVTDGFGCKDSLTRTAYIFVSPTFASYTLPTSVCVGSAATFGNTSTPHTSRTWNYGDGSATDTSYDGTHTYIAPGTYNVTLTIVNGPCVDVETHTITVTAPPTATFAIIPTDPCPAPVTISYASTAPSGSTVSWVFEGGATGTGSTTSFNYVSNGIKTVKMIVTDALGCVSTIIKKDTIYDLHFFATGGPTEGCVPLTVNFTTLYYTRQPDTTMPVHPYPFPIVSYMWDFGDGSTPSSAGMAPTHTYTAVGLYTAIVTATTSNGCTVVDSVHIRVGAPPTATFTISPTHICYGGTVIYTATVISGPIDRYDWDMGYVLVGTGGSTYYHIHTLPGVFTTTLTPYFRGCPGTPYVSSIVVTVDSPKAIIDFTHACSPLTEIHFIDKSMGDDSHLWMFGDGTTSTLDSPVHVYPSIGSYTVTLATYNATSGCRDTAQSVIDLAVPPLDFTAHDTAVCLTDTVFFSSLTPDGPPSSITWFVDGLTRPWWNDSTMIDTFTTSGYHTVMLTVINSQFCPDTVTKTNYIIVGDPHAGFAATPTAGCWPLLVTFTDTSTDVPGAPIGSHFWDFGDGSSTTVTTTPTAHLYTVADTFYAKELVTDIIGCIDSAGPVQIIVYRPHAAFTASNVHPCINVPVNFSNTSTAYASSFWSFGDGTTSTGSTPTHTYTTTGSYTVMLVVTDLHGCTDTMTMPGYINVTKPVAAFNMSDTFSICIPLLVNFTNMSTGGTTYNWTFGDGNISPLYSPANLYTAAGYYPVRLIVTNTWGCTDTANDHLNLYGYSGSLSYTPYTGCVPLLVHFTAAISNVPNIIWDFGDGYVSALSMVDTASHLYTVPGAYLPKLILSDNSGCEASSVGPFTIKVDSITAKFGVSPAACVGMPFNLVDSSTFYWAPIDAWFWEYGGDTSSLSSPVHSIDTPGRYPITMTVWNSWGCTATVTDSITVYPLPVITASGDTIVCVGDPATLTGYGGISYNWDGPAGTLGCILCNPANATPTIPSTYSVTGTDVYGCKNTAVVDVGLRTHTFGGTFGDTSVCFGNGVQISDTGGHTYLWIPAGGLSSNTVSNPIASPGSTTTYTVIAQLGSCIPDTDYVKIEVFSLPTVYAGPDQEVLAGTPVELNASGLNIAYYRWSPDTGLSCNACRSPEVTILETTTFEVAVTSPQGCKSRDSVTIFVFCNENLVFLPNVFTPNGDGQNDVFYPRGAGIKTIKFFRIYNRWGELLFERTNFNVNDASNAWDGTYQGGEPKTDVFVYVVDAVCSTGKRVLVKGDVTIVR